MGRPAPEMKEREPLSGLVERVTFHSGESGFCVLRVKLEAKTIHRLLEFDPKEAGFLRGADLRRTAIIWCSTKSR
jgi:hypothetical protein